MFRAQAARQYLLNLPNAEDTFIEVLIAHRTEADKFDFDADTYPLKRTLLHYAFMRNHHSLASFLNFEGACPIPLDCHGFSPYHLMHPHADPDEWLQLLMILFESGARPYDVRQSIPIRSLAVKNAWSVFQETAMLRQLAKSKAWDHI